MTHPRNPRAPVTSLMPTLIPVLTSGINVGPLCSGYFFVSWTGLCGGCWRVLTCGVLAALVARPLCVGVFSHCEWWGRAGLPVLGKGVMGPLRKR